MVLPDGGGLSRIRGRPLGDAQQRLLSLGLLARALQRPTSRSQSLAAKRAKAAGGQPRTSWRWWCLCAL